MLNQSSWDILYYEALNDNFEGHIKYDEPMNKHTSYKIGGPAKVFVRANTVDALRQLILKCKELKIPYMVIGKGSNLLFSDEGYDGVIITLSGNFKSIKYYEDKQTYIVGPATLLSSLVNDALKRSVSGMEFAVGTPGNIGGAIKGNAGTVDKSISDILISVKTMDQNGEITTKPANTIDWGYRYSSIKDDEIILEAEIKVNKLDHINDIQALNDNMNSIMTRRHKVQPLNFPSCGSVFKNPQGYSAGKLIEDCNIKGMRIGDAMISAKHANFIVNVGHAKAADVVELINIAQENVYKKFNVKLIPEVKFIGFEKSCSLF